MKQILSTLLFVLTSTQALAEVRYVCREITGPKQTVVLTSKEDIKKIDDGSKHEFKFEYYKHGKFSSPVLAEIKATGEVSLEDVELLFRSNDDKISFKIYLDEMDQSSLIVSEKDLGQFVCY